MAHPGINLCPWCSWHPALTNPAHPGIRSWALSQCALRKLRSSPVFLELRWQKRLSHPARHSLAWGLAKLRESSGRGQAGHWSLIGAVWGFSPCTGNLQHNEIHTQRRLQLPKSLWDRARVTEDSKELSCPWCVCCTLQVTQPPLSPQTLPPGQTGKSDTSSRLEFPI